MARAQFDFGGFKLTLSAASPSQRVGSKGRGVAELLPH